MMLTDEKDGTRRARSRRGRSGRSSLRLTRRRSQGCQQSTRAKTRRNQTAVFARCARAIPTSAAKPIAEIGTTGTIRFAQQQFTVVRQMLAPKMLQRLPLKIVVKNIGAHDQWIFSRQSISSPIDSPNGDSVSPRPRVSLGKRQSWVGIVDHPYVGTLIGRGRSGRPQAAT